MCLDNLKATTIKEAIYSDSPTIFKLSLISDAVVISILNALIIDFVQFLNLGKSMNAQQVLQTSKLIISDTQIKNLKPDDFKIAFNKAKMGHYGKFYDRVDGQVIFEILNAYIGEKLDMHENLANQLHYERKNEKINPSEINPEGQKKVLEILKEAVKNTDVEKKEKKPIIKSEREILIQKYFKEFDELYKMVGFDTAGIRFIKQDDVIFDQVEFVEFKLENK